MLRPDHRLCLLTLWLATLPVACQAQSTADDDSAESNSEAVDWGQFTGTWHQSTPPHGDLWVGEGCTLTSIDGVHTIECSYFQLSLGPYLDLLQRIRDPYWSRYRHRCAVGGSPDARSVVTEAEGPTTGSRSWVGLRPDLGPVITWDGFFGTEPETGSTEQFQLACTLSDPDMLVCRWYSWNDDPRDAPRWSSYDAEFTLIRASHDYIQGFPTPTEPFAPLCGELFERYLLSPTEGP